ncbi:MAG: FMN-binding protein [Sulfuricurvum sp.]|nr:FMN-binding protein [Sulfuricurvum sp.]MDP3023034.1 FMN-binding protein [Sulfuricurvum sp.]
MIKTATLLFLLFNTAFAQVLGDPVALTQLTFNAKSVDTRNIILNDAQVTELSKLSMQKINTKLHRIYLAKNGEKTVGYGVLMNQKVRTKTAIALYLIGLDKKIKSIEIVAFNEPLEYLPSATWLNVFDQKSSANTLKLNQDIPTTTGATLSARAITDGARAALALLEIVKL